VYARSARRNSRSRRPEMHIDTLVLAGITATLAYVITVDGILRRGVRMNVATWGIWSFVNIITTTSIISSGFTHPWMNLVFTVGAVVTLLLSIWRGTWSWTKRETLCTLIALAAMVSWFFFGATTALVLGVTAMGVGGIPQIIDAYHRPEQQDGWVWFLFVLSNALSLSGAPIWDTAHLLYPFVGVTSNGLLLIFILVRPRSNSTFR
jgi:hypothetical protein